MMRIAKKKMRWKQERMDYKKNNMSTDGDNGRGIKTVRVTKRTTEYVIARQKDALHFAQTYRWSGNHQAKRKMTKTSHRPQPDFYINP
jgi:frataxin-like iron-binding protein CyaY